MKRDFKWWLQRQTIWRWERLHYNLTRSWSLVRASWDCIDPDWSALAVLMIWQLRRTREAIVTNDIVVSAQRSGRQMLICETLLKRMLDDHQYFENARRRFPHDQYPNGNGFVGKMVVEIEKQDMEMLARYMRYMHEWWD